MVRSFGSLLPFSRWLIWTEFKPDASAGELFNLDLHIRTLRRELPGMLAQRIGRDVDIGVERTLNP